MRPARRSLRRWGAILAAAVSIPSQLAAQSACAPEAGLRFICGPINAEDLVRVPDTNWILASGLADGEGTSGHIYLINARDRTFRTLLPGHVSYRQDLKSYRACAGTPSERHFAAQGLSLRAGNGSRHTLYVVHHGEREAIEIFRLEARYGVPSLTWIGCVPLPEGAFGNSVAALPAGGFVVTNFMNTNDPRAVGKLMAGQPTGGLLIWRPESGWEKVSEAAEISADNGVEVSPNGKYLFVTGSGDGTLVRISMRGQPRARKVIRTGFPMDNLRWGSDGYLYASGQRDTMSDLWMCAPNTKRRCTAPFSVLKIDPARFRANEVIRHPGSASFGAASTALRIGNNYWLGTPHGDRIAIATADDLTP